LIFLLTINEETKRRITSLPPPLPLTPPTTITTTTLFLYEFCNQYVAIAPLQGARTWGGMQKSGLLAIRPSISTGL
jgi:hypothetical protein